MKKIICDTCRTELGSNAFTLHRPDYAEMEYHFCDAVCLYDYSLQFVTNYFGDPATPKGQAALQRRRDERAQKVKQDLETKAGIADPAPRDAAVAQHQKVRWGDLTSS
tara:strand:- start:138 stop:461 length:324 start_codon:yes stop_codon:yes gene_type:complete